MCFFDKMPVCECYVWVPFWQLLRLYSQFTSIVIGSFVQKRTLNFYSRVSDASILCCLERRMYSQARLQQSRRLCLLYAIILQWGQSSASSWEFQAESAVAACDMLLYSTKKEAVGAKCEQGLNTRASTLCCTWGQHGCLVHSGRDFERHKEQPLKVTGNWACNSHLCLGKTFPSCLKAIVMKPTDKAASSVYS